MEMMLLPEQLEKLKGWYVKDCVVRTRHFFHLSARNSDESEKAGPISEHSVSKKEFGIYLNQEPQKQFSSRIFTGLDQLYVGASSTPGSTFNEVVFVDAVGQVYARGSAGHNGMEDSIPTSEQGPSRGIISRIRMIQGRLYFVGFLNAVGYREGPNLWKSLCLNLPIPKDEKTFKKEDKNKYRLNDIDGFSYDDLYIVGGKGNVWHFDGKEWKQISVPTNMQLESVCCGGDGFVYIGAQSGCLFKGRGSQWEMIHHGEFTLPFKDIVWHAGKLWCTSDYGLWCVENDKLISADIPAEIHVCSGNLSVADGVMLMAGMFGAAWHDGKDWHLIFNSSELQDNE